MHLMASPKALINLIGVSGLRIFKAKTKIFLFDKMKWKAFPNISNLRISIEKNIFLVVAKLYVKLFHDIYTFIIHSNCIFRVSRLNSKIHPKEKRRLIKCMFPKGIIFAYYTTFFVDSTFLI